MAIFRKEHLVEPLKALDEYYKKLREVAVGDRPADNAAHAFGFEDVDQFARGHVDIDLDRLKRQIDHFKVEVDSLISLKKHILKLPHRS